MAVEQKKSQVLDLSRPGGIGVEIDVSEAAEVLMSLAAVLDDDDTRSTSAGNASPQPERPSRLGLPS
jgi:hypothetical protein